MLKTESRSGFWNPRRVPAATLAGFCALAAFYGSVRAQRLVDWDAVNYAFALHRYDVAHDQPHMPGYFLYILFARLFRMALPDDNTALVAVSGVFALGTWYLIGRIARDRYGTRWGIAAGLAAALSPVISFQGVVASSRAGEGFFALLVFWLALQTRRRPDGPALYALVLALSAATGIRQQSLLFLAPLCLWAVARQPRARILVACALFVAATAFWVGPMLTAVGGGEAWRERARLQWDAFVVADTGVFYAPTLSLAIQRLGANCARVLYYSAWVVGPGLALLPAAVMRRRRLDDWRTACFLAVVPPVAFFVLFHIQQTGHILSIAGLLILSVVSVARSLPKALAGVAVIGAGPFFLFGSDHGIGDQLPPTIAALRANDRFVDRSVATIRSLGSAETVGVLATDASSRLFDYYLPQYRTVTVLQQREGLRFVRSESGPETPMVVFPNQIQTLVIAGRTTSVRYAADRLVLHTRWNAPSWTVFLEPGTRYDPTRRALSVVRPTLERTPEGLRLRTAP